MTPQPTTVKLVLETDFECRILGIFLDNTSAQKAILSRFSSTKEDHQTLVMAKQTYSLKVEKDMTFQTKLYTVGSVEKVWGEEGVFDTLSKTVTFDGEVVWGIVEYPINTLADFVLPELLSLEMDLNPYPFFDGNPNIVEIQVD